MGFETSLIEVIVACFIGVWVLCFIAVALFAGTQLSREYEEIEMIEESEIISELEKKND